VIGEENELRVRSDMGYQMGILVFSATGTTVVVEPEAQS
jgi:hypothetical protein